VKTCLYTALKGERTAEPSVHTTTSDAKSLLKSLAAASGRPESERKQPSMKVVTVKFEGLNASEWGLDTKSDFF